MKTLLNKLRYLGVVVAAGIALQLGMIGGAELVTAVSTSQIQSGVPSAALHQHSQPSVAAVTAISSAEAAALSDFAENRIVDAVLRGQALGAPATNYVALYTACPTDSTAGTEVTGGSYARVAVTASLANWAGTQSAGSTTASSGTGGTTSNNNAITFPAPTANWGTIVCWSITDAASAGNVWIYAPLTVNKTVNNGDAAPAFAAGAATFQADN